MKGLFISFGIWLGILQVPAPRLLSVEGVAQLLGAAGALAGLTVMVYRLGVWRQEIYNTKHDVAGEIARYREESSRDFARIVQRLDGFDQIVAAANQYRLATERWQGRVDTRLDGHDREITAVADRVVRLEVDEAA
jgi:hypothetical protein